MEREYAVPVAFLTAKQRSRSGCLVGEPSPEQQPALLSSRRPRPLVEPNLGVANSASSRFGSTETAASCGRDVLMMRR